MSGKFVRASKYRHVFGQATKKELCYENLKITKNAWDSNIITTNGKYLACNWDASGGGAFAVIPLSEVGKAPDTVPLFRGHKGPVLDTAFNPFNEQQVVSCSDDGNILLWDIPEDFSFHNYVDENDNPRDIVEPTKVLSGHKRKVGHVAFHPCAENVLASCSLDYTVKIWDLESGEAKITLPHKDLVTSFAFNYNGSLLATTTRDKKLRIWDLREEKIISEGPGHSGAKPSRVVWVGNTYRVITTGFSRLSDRQVGMWDVKNIEKGPIGGFMVIDASSGVLIPVFDESNNILYLAGKGDGNIRYYEYDNDELYELSQFPSTDAQRGFAWAPKTACNVKENEILRCFKTVNDSSIEPVSFIVPRKSENFQEDIYPDAPSHKPALSAAEWFSGKNVNGPLLVKMEAIYEGKQSEVVESKPAVSVSEVKKEAKAAKEKKKAASKEAKASPQHDDVKPVESSTSQDVKGYESPKDKVGDVLKSDKVDNLLNKVTDESDDEDSKRLKQDEEKDEDWEEVKKPESLKESTPELSKKEDYISKLKPKAKEMKEESKAESVKEESKAEPVKTEEKKSSPSPKLEQPVQAKKDVKKDVSKEITPTLDDPKEEEPKKESPRKEDSKKEESKATGAPTLRSTVDKLAKLVESLESQVVKLTEANADKNSKIDSLEKKIEELLKK
ncbi:hypothetical_protein [Candidozyma auris]|uniref:hypothetical_protein n=1 Tax=Candidozyma auris TaxID=498019 RepID=UPI000D26E786|nr:hypothetical_protein [[Candida] auris]QEO22845.1 hypothetical_protein [[Candida] auris]GBL48896.1 hypothetical protein CAJCM15448_11700 [[Candida] auris]